jgi:rod shape-determining protein MreC
VRTPKRIVFTAAAITLIAVTVALNSRSIANRGRAGLSDASSAPLGALRGFSSAAARLVPFAGLRDENRRLRAQVDLLKRQIVEAAPIAAENARLKEMLAFRKELGYATVPAEVIGRDLSNWSNSIIIGKGIADGIRPNAAVLSARGLVGRVLEVGRYSSRILLITDPNSKVGVVIQRNRQGGMLVGGPGGRCRMIYIALDSDVAKGDRVVTAGLSAVFPRGILAGEVAAVGREPGRLYKYAVIETAQDMSKLEEVLCTK